MKTSETINEFAAAFAKAQGAMGAASKDAKGNFGKYATLAAIWDVIRAPLAENHLAVMQCPEISENGVCVQLRVVHSSGQWLETELRVPVNKQDAQGVGSAISYASRYQLRTVFGIPSDDDDDGQAAVKAAPKQAQTPQHTQAQQPARPQQAAQQAQQTRPAPATSSPATSSPATSSPATSSPATSSPATSSQTEQSTAMNKNQVDHISSLRTAILATRKMVDTDWRPFLAFAVQDDTLTEPSNKPNRVQAEAFISRFGKPLPDGTLELDVPALETCLGDWDEALERERAVKLPVDSNQKDFDGLGA